MSEGVVVYMVESLGDATRVGIHIRLEVLVVPLDHVIASDLGTVLIERKGD